MPCQDQSKGDKPDDHRMVHVGVPRQSTQYVRDRSSLSAVPILQAASSSEPVEREPQITDGSVKNVAADHEVPSAPASYGSSRGIDRLHNRYKRMIFIADR